MKRISIVTTLLVLAVSIFAYLHTQKELTRREKFPLLRAKYYYYLELEKTWDKVAHFYGSQICLSATEDWKGQKRIGKTLTRYEKKQENCRDKAETILLKACRSALTKEDFDWIYTETYATNPADVRFLRKTIDNVFRNKNFYPDSLWVAARKDILGREYYIK